MIKIPDHSWWEFDSDRRENFREAFSKLTEAVESTLSEVDRLYTKKKVGIIAWVRAPIRARASEMLYFVWLVNYNSFTFRLNSTGDPVYDITAKFWPPISEVRRYRCCAGERLTNRYRFELSFCAEDLPQVATPALVRFVESAFVHHDEPEAIWRWPLFAHYQSYPHYAWSVAGSAEYERRRKIREEYKERGQKQVL